MFYSRKLKKIKKDIIELQKEQHLTDYKIKELKKSIDNSLNKMIDLIDKINNKIETKDELNKKRFEHLEKVINNTVLDLLNTK